MTDEVSGSNPRSAENSDDPSENDDSSANDVGNDISKPTRALYRMCAPDHFRTRLHISYDGTDFLGWQRQTKHVSVQGCLETALTQIFGKPISLLGASRTDAGVHAHQQVAHCDLPRDPSAFDLRYSLQCMTPDSIAIKEIFSAPPDFHSIACVTDKIYKYQILNRQVPSALRHRYTHWVRFPLDLEYLNTASRYFLGKQDFKSFQSAGTVVLSTVRTVNEVHWARVDDDLIEFTIRGGGFLKQMVRNIVGTLLQMNHNNEKPERVRDILQACDRRRAGPTAPAQGLFLHQVNYPEVIDKKCRKL